MPTHSSPSHFSMRRCALICGVNYYQDERFSNLRYCVGDAEALRELFLSHPAYGYSSKGVALLTSKNAHHDEATRLNILEQLARFADEVQEQDMFLFYFSGHGTVIDGKPYLIPSDARDGRLLADTAIPLQRVVEFLKSNIKARTKVIMLDTCYAGVELRIKALQDASEVFLRGVERAFTNTEGIAILASSSRNEPSIEDADKEHGVFTYYLLQALQDSVVDDNHDHYLTISEVFRYVAARVNEEYKQKPTLKFEGTGEIAFLPTLKSRQPNVGALSRTFPMAVKDTRDFYDRDEELAEVKRILEMASDVMVIIRGERCVGKTSFLNRIKNLIKEESWSDRRILYFSIEPRSIRNVEDFALEIWEGVTSSLTRGGYELSSETETFRFESFVRFSRTMEKISNKAPDVSFVIFADEFDRIGHLVRDSDYEAIIGLVHHLLENTEFPVIFCLSFLRDLPKTYGSQPPSHRIILHPFDQASFGEMMQDLLAYPRSRSNDEFLKQLYAWSGGNPYFGKLLLMEFIDLKAFHNTDNKPLSEIIAETVQRAVQNPNAEQIFREVYEDYLSENERYLLLWLASKENYTLDSLEFSHNRMELRAAARRLVARDYFIEEANGNYLLRIKLFGAWLRRWRKFRLEVERLKIPGAAVAKVLSPSISIQPNGIYVDLGTHEVYVEGQRIDQNLSDMQFRALVYLARHAGHVVGREELFQHLYGANYITSEQSLDSLIYRIRKALNDDSKQPKYLETLRGQGFRMKNIALGPDTALTGE